MIEENVVIFIVLCVCVYFLQVSDALMVMMCLTCFVVTLVSIGYIQYRHKKDNDKLVHELYFRQGDLDPETLEWNENMRRIEESVSRMVLVMMITFAILNLSSNFSKLFLIGNEMIII